MLIRDYKGAFINIHQNDFLNDKEFYIALWKIKFNIDLSKQKKSFNNTLIKYIQGITFSI